MSKRHIYSLILAVCFLGLSVPAHARTYPAGNLTGQMLKASKHASNGKRFLKMKKYYLAACSYLDALDLKPGKRTYLKRVAPIAENAYRQKKETCETYYQQGDYQEAVSEYRELKRLLESMKTHGLVDFAPINVDKAIEKASQGASKEEYQAGESLFSKGSWAEAIPHYMVALEFTPGYEDATEKVAECYYAQGQRALSGSGYREAAAFFKTSVDTLPGYKDAQKRYKELHYQLGNYFLEKRLYRTAWNDFEHVRLMDPQYKNLSLRQEAAYDGAVRRIAFGEFENLTGYNIGGIALGNYIFQELKSVIRDRGSRFIRVAQSVGDGDYVVTGRVNQATSRVEGPTSEHLYERCEWTEYQRYRGRDGKTHTRDIPRAADVRFTVHEAKREVIISGNVTMVEAKSNDIIVDHQISSRLADSVKYADSVYPAELFGKLSYQVAELLKARQELHSEDVMIKSVITEIVDGLGEKIVAAVDREESSQDPNVLTLDL